MYKHTTPRCAEQASDVVEDRTIYRPATLPTSLAFRHAFIALIALGACMNTHAEPITHEYFGQDFDDLFVSTSGLDPVQLAFGNFSSWSIGVTHPEGDDFGGVDNWHIQTFSDPGFGSVDRAGYCLALRASTGRCNIALDAGVTGAPGALTSVNGGLVGVPDPTTIALLGLGLAGVGFTRRRKQDSATLTSSMISPIMVARVVLLALLVGMPWSAQADPIIDDDFTGTSSGTPSGWSESIFAQDGTYDDSGPTTVEFVLPGPGDIAQLRHNTLFDPSAGVEWSVEVESLDAYVFQSGIGLDVLDPTFFLLRLEGLSLSALAGPLSGFDSVSLGSLSGYSGGALDLTVQLLIDGFRVQTSTGLDSGMLGWSVFSNGYTLADQGDEAGFTLQISSSSLGLVGGVGVFDRVTVLADAESPPVSVPEPSTILLLAAGLLSLGATKRRRAI